MENRKYHFLFILWFLFISHSSVFYLDLKSAFASPHAPRHNPLSNRSFSIILLPDTQYYHYREGSSLTQIFGEQINWIIDRSIEENIIFVGHLGDITDLNTEKEWETARVLLSQLDHLIPYSIIPGNHDCPHVPLFSRDTTLFNKYFPVSKFKLFPYFGGLFNPDKMDNSFSVLDIENLKFLILNLEFGPRNEVLSWANQVLGNYPDRTVIILTHGYLNYDGTLSKSLRSEENEDCDSCLDEAIDRVKANPFNSGADMWAKLISRHENIRFVFNGHITKDIEGGHITAGRTIGVGSRGNKVFQMASNYQGVKYGGSGYLRKIKFDYKNAKIIIKTYSPWLNRFLNDESNDFEINLTSETFQNNQPIQKTSPHYSKSPEVIEQLYSDGTLKSALNYKNDKLEGTAQTYYPNGQKKQVARFKAGKLEGAMKTYFKNGILNRNVNFQNGLREGLAEAFYPNGKLYEVSNYKKGQLNGPRKTFHKNGISNSTENFLKGILNGTRRVFFDNNKIAEQFIYKSGKVEGAAYFYFRSGIVKKIENFKDGIKTGLSLEFNPKGSINFVKNFYQGYENGVRYTYNEEGALIEKYTYEFGDRSGPVNYYYPNGNLKLSSSYVNGKPKGVQKTYHKNGDLRSLKIYEDGIINGITLIFYSDKGNPIKLIVNKRAGVQEGIAYLFYKNGQLQGESFFQKGKLNGKAKKYFENGVLSKREGYQNGKRHGKSEEFYPNGALKIEVMFRDGLRNGTSKSYYPDSTVAREQTFNNGNKTGAWKIYTPKGKLAKEMYYKNDKLLQTLLY